MRNLALKAYTWAKVRNTNEEGQTVIEYALVTAVVSIALIALMAGFGTGIISDINSKLDAYVTP